MLSSPEDNDNRTQHAGLSRMRTYATALLALISAVFAFSVWGEKAWPWLAPVRAFAEAALVGGIADWFAVTALFRHPFGLPIPHTAVIPRNHGRIAAAIGRFVADNLLASQALAQRLEELDTAGRLGRWLARPETAAMIAARIAGSLPPIVDTIGEQRWRSTIGGGLRKVVDTAITAPRMANILSYMVGRGYHHAILDHLVTEARSFVAQNRSFIRAKVAKECPEWLPLWVETQIAQGVTQGIDGSLGELTAPDHPWRLKFELFVHETIDGMTNSPHFAQRIEEVKMQVLDDPALDAYLRQLGSSAYDHLMEEAKTMEMLLENGLREIGQRLEHDTAMRATLNRWLRDATEALLVPRRELIGSLITDLVMRWRTPFLIEKLESHVGKDLQYIRINGTVVGGLVGLAIYTVTTLAQRKCISSFF
ncbi:hypothetical protein WV31_02080 [Magnetospirillum sp. ME-1]|uniref:Predicted membrane protein n=1 Tax=Paramagnetospirillum magneticum (strain ATCC 700264 / AMB-1) TaxID=342108 RepID=Q2W8R1_PARM1|nr:hypothetical protein WV31_02080 [Magnetospirillum sp. ME-1]BAE49764.1 Predicted membrane protein [Paramagnetospirillum magneticum AMB-1]